MIGFAHGDLEAPDRPGSNDQQPFSFTHWNPDFPRYGWLYRLLSLSPSGQGLPTLQTPSKPSDAMQDTGVATREDDELTIIELDDELDRWKWVCPRGHRDWEPTNRHFWCASCARSYDVDPEFSELHNRKTGERLDRDDLILMTQAGPFGHREGGSA
jgi:hypothetical protein